MTQPTIHRTILNAIPIPELPGWESRLVIVEYEPGAKAPEHTHPVAATGYVLEGDVISLWENGEVERYSQGDSFIDHGVRLHLRSDNPSTTKPLKMLFSYVIRVGQPNVSI